MSFKQTALRLISKKGIDVTFKRVTQTENISEPWKNTISTEDHTVKVVIVANTKDNRESLKYRKDSSVVFGEDIAYMASQSFEPQNDDVLVVNNKERSILNIRKYRDKDVIVLYEMEIE